MHVRPAALADVPSLAKALAPLPLFLRYGLGEASLVRRWAEALAVGEGLVVAEEDGEPRGLCWYLPRGAFALGGYLRTLAVVPKAQGHGVGGMLLRAYEEASRGAQGGLFLLVSDFNLEAQRFYSRHGYQEAGRLPGLVVKDVTELIYWKRG
jgi:ribosomal protein S18 acetylase RimI-like enzyme